MKRLKIVNVVLNGNFTDGMAYQENCLPYYQSRVYDADVVIISGQNSLKKGTNESEINKPGEYILSNGLRLVRITSPQGMLKKFSYMPELYDVLEKERPDYIFVHLVQSLYTKIVVKYKRIHPDVIVFADSHSDDINSAHGYISRRILHGIIWKNVLQEASEYFETIYGVLPSRVSFLKKVYQLENDKVDLLMMGAEDELIDYENHCDIRLKVRENLGVLENDFLIITGGKIDKKKNIDVIVEAIKSISDSRIKLIIFGHPNEEMRVYINSLIDIDWIRYLGWISSDKMYEYLHGVDLCCFPGTHSVLWEQTIGFGMPGIFRYWDGMEHIDCDGNMRFFYNKSVCEMKELLEEILYGEKVFENMKIRAELVREKFHYTEIAKKSIRTRHINREDIVPIFRGGASRSSFNGFAVYCTLSFISVDSCKLCA